MKRHTFLVLAYKDSPYLEGCLKSLLHQRTPSEIILCTSTPSAFISEIASRYAIELRINPLQEGMGADWEFAYRQAQTPFLTLAHQDDLYKEDYTTELLALAERFPAGTLIFPDYAEILSEGWRAQTVNLLIKRLILRFGFGFSRSIASSFWKRITLSFGNPICCPAVMYNKSLIGEITFSRAKRFVLDWEVWIDLAMRPGAFVYLPKCLMGHRIHPDSETTKVTECEVRTIEEREMFYRLWPASVAFVLNAFYGFSHNSNRSSQAAPNALR